MKNPFIKLYLNKKTIFLFKGISGTEVLFLLEMVRIMDYENLVQWSAAHKYKFCHENIICLDINGKFSSASFSNFMGRLCRKGLIIRLKRNNYRINPEVFYR